MKPVLLEVLVVRKRIQKLQHCFVHILILGLETMKILRTTVTMVT